MIVRLALLLLAVVLVLGVIKRFGKRRVGRPSAPPPIEAARRCPDCNAYVVGDRPEPCLRPDCRFRAA